MKQKTPPFPGFWRLVVVGLFLVVTACKPSPAPSTPFSSPMPSVTKTASPPETATATTTSTPTRTLLSTSTATPTATPAPLAIPIHGIEIHRLPDVLPSAQAGAFWMRKNALLWHQVERVEGERNWNSLATIEAILKTAAEQSQTTILIVRSTPPWAQKVPGYYCGPVKAEKFGAFASFMADLVARYSVPPYNVKYWEIGNEPDVAPSQVPPDNLYGCWGQEGDPYFGGEYYAEMLKVVYPQIKKIDPQAQVLVGGLMLACDPNNPPESTPGSGQLADCTSARFIEGILKNGGGDYFDGISFHAYDYFARLVGRYGNGSWHSVWNTTGPTLSAKADFLNALLARYGVEGKYLMNTEIGLLCGSSGDESFCRTEAYANMKSAYLAQSYVAALAKGLYANIWFSITGWRGSALLDSARQPNSTYQALRASSDRLAKAAFWGEIGDYPGVKGYEFYRGGTRIWVLWAMDDEAHTVKLPNPPAAVYDVLGAALPVAQEVVVTIAPLYVEWNP